MHEYQLEIKIRKKLESYIIDSKTYSLKHVFQIYKRYSFFVARFHKNFELIIINAEFDNNFKSDIF